MKQETIDEKKLTVAINVIIQYLVPFWRQNINELKNVDVWEFYKNNLNNDFVDYPFLQSGLKFEFAKNLEIPAEYQFILLTNNIDYDLVNFDYEYSQYILNLFYPLFENIIKEKRTKKVKWKLIKF